MKRNLIFLYCLLIIPLFCNQTRTNRSTKNYFEPGAIWIDNNGIPINAHSAGIIRVDNKYYWFGEHKIEGPKGNTAMVGVSCYSSVDLYNWKNEGIVLNVSEDTTSLLRKGCIIERPKVIYNSRTKKFVMWFHHELYGQGYSTALSGVAISDDVTGPYKYLKSIRPNKGFWPINVNAVHKNPVSEIVKDHYGGSKGALPHHPDTLNILGRDFEKGQMARDMTLFVDDDGKAYHIYSSEENSTTHISMLTDDYLSFSGKYIRVFIERYMEAPTIFKHKGEYFFIGSDCTGWKPNAARLAVASEIWGPWKELGNPCRGTEEQQNKTFWSQGTFVLPLKNKKDAFIFMADRWMPENPIDGRYVWLPLKFDENGYPNLGWIDKWNITDNF
jgi:beta-xylosidase